MLWDAHNNPFQAQAPKGRNVPSNFRLGGLKYGMTMLYCGMVIHAVHLQPWKHLLRFVGFSHARRYRRIFVPVRAIWYGYPCHQHGIAIHVTMVQLVMPLRCGYPCHYGIMLYMADTFIPRNICSGSSGFGWTNVTSEGAILRVTNLVQHRIDLVQDRVRLSIMYRSIIHGSDAIWTRGKMQ